MPPCRLMKANRCELRQWLCVFQIQPAGPSRGCHDHDRRPTAWRALVADGALKAGDVVLVLGTGGVAIAALQIAKLMGAARIITSSSDESSSAPGHSAQIT